ncbi:MAG TPA: potassium channel protein [Candidatus Methanoperedens sp.]|nr:potassium channel protein [Candidatus Methanoperedens sp.]
MAESLHAKIRRKALIAGGLLAIVLGVGTATYKHIGGERATWLDSLYMVVITIATIGYGEIIDLSQSPGGRVFTMFLSFAGIGILTYIMMSLTAFVVEGELNEAFRRRKMEKRIEKLREHYIVCGADGVGSHVARELAATQRPYVVVDTDREKIERFHGGGDEGPAFIVGDATDNETLRRAGIERARGLFAVTGDDNLNMVISLSARPLNPGIRVVARCEEPRNSEKMQRAGADSAVSPTRIGGLRMASEMLRPAVVGFLDVMLRREDEQLRIEELAVPAAIVGRSLAALELQRFAKLLLLAVRHAEGWTYNPARDYVMQTGDTLVFMGSPEERVELERVLTGDGGRG